MPQDTSDMDALGVLDNLVANTAYLNAQQTDRSELRKRRSSLLLPKPKNLRSQDAPEKLFESLCEHQPIGKRLFQQFLSSVPHYLAASRFLEELIDWHYAEDQTKNYVQKKIINKFCLTSSRNFLSFLTGDAAEALESLSEDNFENLIPTIKDATIEFLKGKPFSEYLESPFYYKFLQWKEFEKGPITNKYFYEFRILGKGGFGEVCAVQAKYSGQMYACKKLHKSCLKKKGGERLALLEKQILDKVNSPFIVNLAYAFETQTHLCLVMDLMIGGDLKFHIYDLGARGLQMDRVVYYSAQIVCGILHLHSLDIIYRDMKPDNVLLDGKGQCCLSDLGLAVELPKGKTMCQKAGTTGYMAPEILKQEYYRSSVDWWALGCSIYEMVAARLPFKDFREKVQNSEVNRRTLEDAPKFEHKNFNEPAKDIITRFLKKKMDYRLGCSRNGDDPRKHAFFKDINFHRLEVGLVEPPWVPKSNLVYAKDMVEFKDISEEEDVALDAKDQKFFKEFSTGAVPVRWQREMIESGVFDELNCFQINGHSLASKSRTCVIT